MQFDIFTLQDLSYLPEFEPPGWGDLVPRFEYFLNSKFCLPLKITVNQQPIAIGASIQHQDTAWLACIITHPDHRSKGLGYQITKRLLESIDNQQFKTVYLIATELGFPVYQKLGFELEGEYTHFKKLDSDTSESASFDSIITYQNKYLSQMYALDAWVSGENRQVILHENLASAKLYVVDNQLLGFYMPSLGDGLIVAQTDEAGLSLLNLRNQVKNYAIVPNDNSLVINYLTQNNSEVYQKSRRMFWGKKRPHQLRNLYHRINGQLG
jgi:N-acetylglutamate synthase-like GNAT family acetyltransferase